MLSDGRVDGLSMLGTFVDLGTLLLHTKFSTFSAMPPLSNQSDYGVHALYFHSTFFLSGTVITIV